MMEEPQTLAEMKARYILAKQRLNGGKHKDVHISRDLDKDLPYEAKDLGLENTIPPEDRPEAKARRRKAEARALKKEQGRVYSKPGILADRKNEEARLQGQIEAFISAAALRYGVSACDVTGQVWQTSHVHPQNKASRLAIALITKHLPQLNLSGVARAMKRHHKAILRARKLLAEDYPLEDVEMIEKLMGLEDVRG